MRHKFHTLTAALLACLLAVQLALPAAAEDSAIHIRNVDDWNSLARSCTLDTWSQGKTVILDCDLELDDAGSIPTFGGIFDGGGHTIRGLSLTADGSHQGLFRYVQEGAVIQNLTVSGRVAPTGTWESLGGIAGVNRGTLVGLHLPGHRQRQRERGRHRRRQRGHRADRPLYRQRIRVRRAPNRRHRRRELRRYSGVHQPGPD